MSVRCLLVDDNEAFLSSASRLLESQGVDVVGHARTSSDALRLARRLRPDVVLVDILLGEERGLDLAKRLSELPRAAPVILISTHTADELEELLAESPAVGFLPKKALSASAIARLLGWYASSSSGIVITLLSSAIGSLPLCGLDDEHAAEALRRDALVEVEARGRRDEHDRIVRFVVRPQEYEAKHSVDGRGSRARLE